MDSPAARTSLNSSQKPVAIILVVDDEQSEAQIISEVLKKAGYAVSTATDGFKAIAACKVRTPDLILLDVQMPFMSGPDVFQRLRNEEKTRFIPIIFMTKLGERPPSGASDEFGDHNTITKPLEASDLISRVKTSLKIKALTDEIRKKEGMIRELSMIDPLTSLHNTRYLSDFLKMELKRAQRYSIPFSVALAEIDQYKELLKERGQNVVDSMLVELAAIMSKGNRQSDLLARTSLCEFCIALPHTPAEGAAEVAERVRNIVAQTQFTVDDGSATMTLSLGICQYAAGMDNEGKILLSHARAALAHARAGGGNLTLMAQ